MPLKPLQAAETSSVHVSDFPGKEHKRVIQGTGAQRTPDLDNSGIARRRTRETTHASLYCTPARAGLGPGSDRGESQSPRPRWRAED